MRNHIMAIAALVSAGALSISAQTPTTPQQPQQQTGQRDQQRAGGNEQTVTITGCLREEKDVPGRSPNVAERAGMGEDYIVTNVKMAQGSATSGIGLAQMYKVEGIDDTELKKHLNHQVEIVGRLEARSGAGMTGAGSGTTGTTGGGTTGTTGTTGGGTTGTTGTTGGQRTGATAQSGGDLQEIQATSIRMVAATCQPKQ